MKETSTTSIIEHIKITSIKKNTEGENVRTILLSKRDNKGLKKDPKKINNK